MIQKRSSHRLRVCVMSILVLVSLQSKKRFEREWREAERAAQYAERTDQDINATKADVEKVAEGKLTVSLRVSHAAKSRGGCSRVADPLGAGFGASRPSSRPT